MTFLMTLKPQLYCSLSFRFPEVYISKEIVQLSDTNSSYFQPRTIEKHLHESLLSPRGKMSHHDHWMPDRRFIRDYFLRGKRKDTLKVVGFSLNLEHLSQVNISWDNIIRDVQTLSIIVFMRCNIVKTAVSGS